MDTKTEGTLAERIATLKKEQDAVILAHYYVKDSAQDVADYIGDSFYLSKLAAGLDCRTLVFAGVRFMAESAKLLSPEKRVLMPEPKADCPMAHMVVKETVDKARAEYGDDLAVACYVNSTTEMKAWSDVCVTSSNAVKIVSRLPQHHVLFIPDMNLGRYVADQVPEKHVILNDGFCPTHEAIELAEIEALKAAHPDAVVCAHPECTPWVVEAADYVGSTSGIIKRVAEGAEKSYIIATVIGVRHTILKKTQGQGKEIFFPETTPICPNMAMVTGEKILSCLETGSGEIQVDEASTEKARRALRRMLELAKD
ncbi:MAG: quinolinate synthase NadA [Atopobiaceae bacterium]